MVDKPHLIFLCHRIPYPPDKGDKIRSWQLFRHLCKSWSVHLGTFIDDPADDQYCDKLSEMAASTCFVPLSPKRARITSLHGLFTGHPLSFAYYRSPTLRRYIRQILKDAPVCAMVGFSSAMAPFLMDHQPPVVMDCCDSDAEKWRAYARTKTALARFIYQREAKLTAQAETDIVNNAHATFAITPAEAALFHNRDGVTKKVRTWENGVDTAYFDPDADFATEHPATGQVVMVGAMDYMPNVEAALWFAENVWPTLRRENPALKFYVVGTKPVPALTKLHGLNGIEVTGRVDDVRPYLADAGVVVAPLQIARGIQNKVLEGMAMARAVVATSGAATGIHADHGREILVADTPGDYASAILSVLADPAHGHAIGKAARGCVLEHYSWQANLTQFDRALHPLRPQ